MTVPDPAGAAAPLAAGAAPCRPNSTTSRCWTSTAWCTSVRTPCPGSPTPWPPRAGPACGWASSPTTPPARPEEVAGHLTELGVPAGAGDVITSAQAAATVVADLFGRRRARAARWAVPGSRQR